MCGRHHAANPFVLVLVVLLSCVRYNIRYGRITASDAEVEEAAQAACIHETITTRFPKVCEAERGLLVLLVVVVAVGPRRACSFVAMICLCRRRPAVI